MTEEQFLEAIKLFDYIPSIADRLKELYDLNEYNYIGFDFNSEDRTIDIKFSYSNCGCCAPDELTITVPIIYLWDKNWYEKEENKVKEQRRLELESEEQEKQNRIKVIERERKEAELREFEEYQKLRKKYEKLTKSILKD